VSDKHVGDTQASEKEGTRRGNLGKSANKVFADNKIVDVVLSL